MHLNKLQRSPLIGVERRPNDRDQDSGREEVDSVSPCTLRL